MKVCLGFDTSCYTSSVAVASLDTEAPLFYAQQRKLLQVAKGKRGLQQSEAVFQHIQNVPELLETLLAGGKYEIAAVCASVKPRSVAESYMPVFRVGEGSARTAAATLHVPFFAATHQQGHLRAALVGTKLSAKDCFLALHLSGGTMETLAVQDGKAALLGGTLDISAGQLIDRIGVRMGLPFPAGPSMEKLADGVQARSRVTARVEGCNCHFSGAEAQALRLLAEGNLSKEEVAAEVFSCIARTVARIVLSGCEAQRMQSVLLSGGVASSAYLHQEIASRVAKRNRQIEIHVGQKALCGDNAVGVAILGAEQLNGQNTATP